MDLQVSLRRPDECQASVPFTETLYNPFLGDLQTSDISAPSRSQPTCTRQLVFLSVLFKYTGSWEGAVKGWFRLKRHLSKIFDGSQKQKENKMQFSQYHNN